MRIFANQKIKRFFLEIMISILIFTTIALVILYTHVSLTSLYIILDILALAVAITIAFFQYFNEQHKTIENATEQITNYIAGNRETRIECNEEGELYRLLHEVNSLVTILDARADNEARSKEFLKTTISDISHQLKTPLAALNIYNGILQEEGNDKATIEEFTHLSEKELDRIETLVQNLLKITKLDAGTIVMEKRPESLSKIMEGIKKHFEFRIKQEGKEIKLSGMEDLTLVCDRVWFMEALDNIVKNAIDHTKCGDSIQIEWRQFASIVRITIKDNGCGIHQEDLPYIFKRFYRSRFSKDTQGIGLGLPLAKAVIEAHNGTIEVDSEPGVGTTFVISVLKPTKL